MSEIASQPAYIAALISSMFGYGVMTLVMSATPLAMLDCGFGFGHSATVIHRLGRLARRLSRKQENKDPSLSSLERHWAVFGDTGTAQRILTPRFNELLATSPRNEVWCLGGDLLCCGYQAPLNDGNLVLFLDRLKIAAG